MAANVAYLLGNRMTRSKDVSLYIFAAGGGFALFLYGAATSNEVLSWIGGLLFFGLGAYFVAENYYHQAMSRPAQSVWCPRCKTEWQWGGVGETLTNLQVREMLAHDKGCPKCR